MNFEVGMKVRIIRMEGEPSYSGRIGDITSIDSIGQLHGTWGGLAIQPENDSLEILNTCCICGDYFTGYGNNPSPLKEAGQCCDKCNNAFVIPARLGKLQ